jgi:hypothetical protein
MILHTRPRRENETLQSFIKNVFCNILIDHCGNTNWMVRSDHYSLHEFEFFLALEINPSRSNRPRLGPSGVCRQSGHPFSRQVRMFEIIASGPGNAGRDVILKHYRIAQGLRNPRPDARAANPPSPTWVAV